MKQGRRDGADAGLLSDLVVGHITLGLTMRTAIFGILTAGLSSAAIAQVLPYTDAQAPGQATGMMASSIVVSNRMLAECSQRFPEYQDEMQTNLRKWQETEARNIRKARYYTSRALSQDPSLKELLLMAESAAVQPLETFSKAPPSQAETAAGVAREYCRNIFKDLASGVWRVRTPHVYEYLDRAPDPPKEFP